MAILMYDYWNEGMFKTLADYTENEHLKKLFSEQGGSIAAVIEIKYNFPIHESIKGNQDQTLLRAVVADWMDEWEKLADLYALQYDPLANKDLHEITTESGSDNYKRGDNTTANSTVTNTNNGITTEISRTTYDDDSYKPVEKSTGSGSTESTSNGTLNLDRNDTTTYGKQTDFTSTGNIGVMSTQELFKNEVMLRLQYCMTDIIIAGIVDTSIRGAF